MYTSKDLKAEIIDYLHGDNVPSIIKPDAVTNAIMETHDDGKVNTFHMFASREHVRKQVTQVFNKMKTPEGEDINPQLTMEGFDQLQQGYTFKAHDEWQYVRTDLASDEMLLNKAAEYVANGDACYSHADEIRRYVQSRKQAM